MAAAPGVVAGRVVAAALVVPGRPVPKGRARVARNGRVYTPHATRVYEREVAAAWARSGRPVLIDGPFVLRAGFVFARPRSHLLAGGQVRRGAPPLPREDGDNLLKSVADALQGLAFADDRLCAEWQGAKRWASTGEAAHARVELAAVLV